jgi:hypothetical protein
MSSDALQPLPNVHGSDPRLDGCELTRHVADAFDEPTRNRI